ncbi:MAG: hypothetical protein A2583_02830 [Bdellovibrionales bacterium RIFOXYD1_FULL_53_11]|nr:MAG: hypothetical protein A2583_02830 [Bdellovibrionales bacterium RIFOXYD1_FULL_53_11]
MLGAQFPQESGSVALLGCGPLEPFEVLTLPSYTKHEVLALDCSSDVVSLIHEAMVTGLLSASTLGSICRSHDSGNPYFTDAHRIRSRLVEAATQGYKICLEDSANGATYRVNPNDKRLRVRRCDLLQAIPKEVSRASLVFEGFMLINWEKTPRLFSMVPLFLERLFRVMPREAWFASATSGAHYLKDFSEPFLRQVLSAGRVPAVGVLSRWSAGQHKSITSQFSAVFQSEETVDPRLSQLGKDLTTRAMRDVTPLGVRVFHEEMSLEKLSNALEEGEVLAFTRQGENCFEVKLMSWAELSGRCEELGTTYELRVLPSTGKHTTSASERSPCL